MLKAAVIILYAVISAYGLYLLKSAPGWRTASFLAGVLFYGAGFLIWLRILRLLPLSVAFPVAAGCLVVATHLFAVLLLKEPLTPLHGVGVALLLSGIFLIYQ